MRKARRFSAAVLLLLGAASPDLTAEEFYDKGGYLEAARVGAAAGDGASLALAARATLAEATLREEACLECLKRAEELARRGIMVDPAYSEGYVELAAALGYQARLVGLMRARLANMPKEAKEAIDKAIMLTPNDPWAMSALAGWNIEVVRMGGSILGSIFFSADVDRGIALYRKAIAADPGNLVIMFNYALALTSYDFEGKRLEIMAVLDAVARGEPRDAYAAALKERAVKLLDLLSQNRRDQYQSLARHYLGFS
jgi:tetratricopeptide (TPR) repeat protein